MFELTGEARVLGLKAWGALSEDTRDMMLELIAMQVRRAECCEPYDCMHHEMCGSDGMCSGCEAAEQLALATREVPAIAWSIAREVDDESRKEVIRHELDTIRQLEAVGDFASAERIMEAQ
jgi:hypothetical protein